MSLHGYPEAYGSGVPIGYVQPSGTYQYQTTHTSLLDPNTFRQFYASHLATLTFNSRPIIQNLSMIAQDYSRMSNVVVQCLEAHIRRVSVSYHLLYNRLNVRCGIMSWDVNEYVSMYLYTDP